MSKGKFFLNSIAGFTLIGGFLADWNKTHLFNPCWTPHSKFHDAMSIMNGFFLGAAGLYFLNRKGGDSQENLLAGVFFPGLFHLSMLSAFLFPGAKGLEAEFPEKIPYLGRLPLNEGVFSIINIGLLSVGYFTTKNYISFNSNMS